MSSHDLVVIISGGGTGKVLNVNGGWLFGR
jgi:hypothetical protein